MVISRLGRWALVALLCSWMLVSAHFPWCIPGSRARSSSSSLAALHGRRHFFPRGSMLLCVCWSSASWSSTHSSRCLPCSASWWRSWWLLAGPVGGAPPRVSLRSKAWLAGGCGGATLDVTGEPYGRAGGGLPLAACEQGHLSLSFSLYSA